MREVTESKQVLFGQQGTPVKTRDGPAAVSCPQDSFQYAKE